MNMPSFANKQWSHILINTEDGCKKFWFARQEGDEYILRWGRLGTNGREMRKKGNAWEKAYEKEQKGYRSVAMPSLLRDFYGISEQQPATHSSDQAVPRKRLKRRKKLCDLPQAKNWNW